MRLKTTVLIVDDHPFIREGIRFYLRDSKSLEVVGEARDGEEAVALALELEPDVVVLDLELPVLDGVEVTRRLREQLPSGKVLAFSMHNEADLISEVVRCGASGYLPKCSSPGAFIEAIETVSRGGTVFPLRESSSRPNDLLQPKKHLTERQKQIATLLVRGLSKKDIANRLRIGVRTVEKHREHIYATLGIRNMADLVRFTVAEGSLTLPNQAASKIRASRD